MRGDRASGFTLVELLVSLALTAAIVIFVLGSIDITRRAWAVSRARDGAEEVDLLQSRLRDIIERTMPSNWVDERTGLARLAFEGTSDHVAFVSLNDIAAARGGLMLVQIAPSHERRGSIDLTTSVFRERPAEAKEQTPLHLFRHVATFSIAYFGRRSDREPAQWHPDWVGQDRLPKLVRLEMTIESKPRNVRLQIPIALRMAE